MNSNLIEKAMIPSDTRKLQIKDTDNLYLKFHKLISNLDNTGSIKINKHNISCYFSNKDIEDISKSHLWKIKKLNLYIEEFECKTNGGLALGLGSESVYKTSMCLHYIYGFPYIPGQIIKGILRNYIINEVFQGKEKIALDNITFCRLFGCDENGIIGSNKGNVYFFDAYPISLPKLKLDIMNPHYGSYYKDQKNNIFPVDYDDTNIIIFPIVYNTKFKFLVGFKKKLKINNEEIEYIGKPVKELWDEKQEEFLSKSLYEITCHYLKEALQEYGLGAKTSVGYGYFDVDNKESMKKIEKERKKKLQEQETLKKQQEKEKEFKEATKNMNELQIELHKINIITDKDKKNRFIMELYNKIDKLESNERRQLATYMKEYLERNDKWKIKKHKNNRKKDKLQERIKKICKILGIELPLN